MDQAKKRRAFPISRKPGAGRQAFRRVVLLFLLIAGLIISQTGCGKKQEPVSQDGFYLDTVCTITLYAMEDWSEEKAETILTEAFASCAEYEALLSKTREGSDVWKVNHADGAPVPCDPRTVELIEKGIHYGELSDGRFDITIGAVTDLWDFHGVGTPQVPDEAVLAEALAHVDYRGIRITGNEVTLVDPAAQLDLGGIAKGYIADRLTEQLADAGVTGAVIDLGGNITVLGYKDGKETEIRVGIRKPFGSSLSDLIGTTSLHDASCVTSGTYERHFEKDGVFYHHILDARTGYPVPTDMDGVTVIGPADASADCDALATTVLLLGSEEAEALFANPEFAGFSYVIVQLDTPHESSSGYSLLKGGAGNWDLSGLE